MLLPNEIEDSKKTILLDFYKHSSSAMTPTFNPRDVFTRTGITPANGNEILSMLILDETIKKEGTEYGITEKGINVVKRFVLNDSVKEISVNKKIGEMSWLPNDETIPQLKRELFPEATNQDWGILEKWFGEINVLNPERVIPIGIAKNYCPNKSAKEVEQICERFKKLPAQSDSNSEVLILNIVYKMLVDGNFKPLFESIFWYPLLEDVYFNQQTKDEPRSNVNTQFEISDLTIKLNHAFLQRSNEKTGFIPGFDIASLIITQLLTPQINNNGIASLVYLNAHSIKKRLTADEWAKEFFNQWFLNYLVKDNSKKKNGGVADKHKKTFRDLGIEECRELVKNNPNDFNAHYQLGLAYAKEQLFSDAIKSFEKAISSNPDFAEVYRSYGLVLKEQGSSDDAIRYFRKAIGLDPNFEDALYDLGVELAHVGKNEEADEMFTRVLELKPNYEKITWVVNGMKTGVRNLSTSILSDLFAQEDELGYENYAKAIVEFIKHKETKTPLSIGIFAPWGVGKTSLLKFIQKRFQNDLKKTKKGKLEYPTIWFNAWKYESSEQIWAALLHEIITGLLSSRSLVEKEWIWIKVRWKKINSEHIKRDFIVIGLFYLFSGVLLYVFHLVWILIPLTVLPSLYITLKKPLLEKIDEYVPRLDYEKKLGFFHEVEKDLKIFLDLLVIQDKPIIILVDDLDRCSPSKTVAIVESLNHFLGGSLPNSIFIIGADASMVASAIETSYGRKEDQKNVGWSFMDKFVQLPFVIPAINTTKLNRFTSKLFGRTLKQVKNENEVSEAKKELEKILIEGSLRASINVNRIKKNLEILTDEKEHKEFVDKFIEKSAEESLDDDSSIQALFNQYKNQLSVSPRLLKRFANLHRFYNYIQYLRKIEGEPYLESEELGGFLVIMLCWPELTRWIQWGKGEMTEDVNTPLKRADFIDQIQKSSLTEFEKLRGLLKERNFELSKDLHEFLFSRIKVSFRKAIITGVW